MKKRKIKGCQPFLTGEKNISKCTLVPTNLCYNSCKCLREHVQGNALNIWKHLYVYDSLSVPAGSLLGSWLWKLIRILCILLIKVELVWGAKHFCDRTQREEKGAKGHINPCQYRPNYLSPCANKQCPGQPVGGGGGWCVRSMRAASDAAAWPPSLLLLSLLLCSVLITPQTQAPGPSDYTQSRAWSCGRATMSSF